MNRPQPNEYAPFYGKYIECVNDNVLEHLEKQIDACTEFLKSIPSDKHNYAYAEGKWTVKEVLGHIIDTERIMTYRLLRFSRNDEQPLQGFEEDEYVRNSTYSARKFISLIEEFSFLRRSNLHLFNALSAEQLALSGTANGNSITVKALLFVIAGHVEHHKQIIQERYL